MNMATSWLTWDRCYKQKQQRHVHNSRTQILARRRQYPASTISPDHQHRKQDDQNSSGSRDTQQKVPQTGFKVTTTIKWAPLQQSEHGINNASLSYNKVAEHQFIQAADSQKSSNGNLRTNYSLMTRPPKIIELCDGNPIKRSMWFGLFEATTHNQPILDAGKINHLLTKLFLVKTANKVISGFSCKALCTALSSKTTTTIWTTRPHRQRLHQQNTEPQTTVNSSQCFVHGVL